MPWPFVGGLFDKPQTLDELAEKVQLNFDALAKQFPVDTTNQSRVPSCRVYNDAALSINDSTATALTFNSERYDNGTSTEQHSTSSDTGRLTCRVPGLYSIGAAVNFASNSTGQRYVALRANGTTTIALDQRPASTTVAACTPFAQWRLAVGDYVDVVVFQSSGGALNVESNSGYSPELFWHWVCP